jgi:hypothetical protein
MKILELYTDLVFLVSIRLVFLGTYQTDTGGKLGRYISIVDDACPWFGRPHVIAQVHTIGTDRIFSCLFGVCVI